MELGTNLKHKGGVLRAIETTKLSFNANGKDFTSQQAINAVMCESKDGLDIYEQMLDIALQSVNNKRT